MIHIWWNFEGLVWRSENHPKMSKQTTLFQCFGYEGNISQSQQNQPSTPSTSSQRPKPKKKTIEEEFLLGDNDDALLIQAMEASMASYEEQQKQTKRSLFKISCSYNKTKAQNSGLCKHCTWELSDLGAVLLASWSYKGTEKLFFNIYAHMTYLLAGWGCQEREFFLSISRYIQTGTIFYTPY